MACDGGPASHAALGWVIDRATTVELALEITAVVGSDHDRVGESEAESRAPYEDALLAAKARATAALPALAVTTKIRRGHPQEALIAASRHADLLVVGTRKASPAEALGYATLPLKLAGRAECVTVVVPIDWAPSTGRVVVGWADDETSDAALDFAAREADHRHAGLTVVHAWATPPSAPLEVTASAIVVDELVLAHTQLLAGAVDRIAREHPGVAVTHGLHAGAASVAILRASAQASLIVVGSRGRGALAGFFLGSVSHDVLLDALVPVAVVPRPQVPADVYPELIDEDPVVEDLNQRS